MLDSEKVIKGLECEKNHSCKQADGNDCPYYNVGVGCACVCYSDALFVIKEQREEIQRLRTQLDEAMLWR